MRKINKIATFLLVLVLAIVTSCKKELTDLNIDSKNPSKVSSGALFANAERALVDQIVTPNVNLNVLRMFAQYWTETTYIDESQYNISTRSIPDREFQATYRDILNDFKEAARVAGEESDLVSTAAEKTNKAAIAEILSVYAFARAVDIFGNLPYDEALNVDNILPKYDDAQTIYSKLFARLDNASNKLILTAGSYKENDIIYGGDVAKWKLFANSLKLKMAITVADVPALNPGVKAQEAITAGVFTSSGDDAMLHYLSLTATANPIYVNLVASGRKDFVAANTLVDAMNTLNDPRRPVYFGSNMTDSVGNVMYMGGVYGDNNDYTEYTWVGDLLQTKEWRGVLLEYSEVLFYQAEAVERGFTGGVAATYYNQAITASFLSWGLTSTQATAYLANPSVAYATATGTYKQKIATQAWIAYYDRPELGWTTWRRLDFPALNPPPDMTLADIRTRYTYPIREQNINSASYTSAAAAIGGDHLTTKLFWDKY